MKQIRLLVGDHFPRISGGQLSLLRFLEDANRKGFEILVACAAESEQFRNAVEALGIRTIPITYNIADADPSAEGRIYRQPLLLTKYIPHIVSATKTLYSIITKHQINLLYGNSFKASALLCCVWTRPRRPLVVRLRTSRAFSSHGWIDRLICTRADALIANSRYVAQTFAPLVRNKSKLHVIYNLGGIQERQRRSKDRDRYQIRSELGLPIDSIVIGQVGRLTRRKRVLDVVRCLPYLSESLRKLVCVFVGSYEESPETQEVYEEARNLAERLGAADRVIFTGQREDALSFINGIDVMVLASEAEPMARVIMEALGLGTPVVVSDHAGNAEIIENKVNGLTYALGNFEALAQALQKVLGDIGLRRKMVENGYRTYDQCFSEEATVAKEQSLLCKIAWGAV